MPNDGGGIEGVVEWVLTGPDGQVKNKGRAFNIITQVGDRRYAEAGAGLGSPPAAATGMKLGTGATAPAKTGATAAAIAAGTYITNSNQAIGTPTSNAPATPVVITYTATFAAGKATNATAITEAVLVNDTIATNAASAEANTLSRVLLTGIGSKGASDTLAVTWTHSIGT